jgi:tellurite resistance protein TehA-like permease
VALRVSRTFSIRQALLKFSSQWFLVPQGCGITAVVLHQLDYQFQGLRQISYVVWVLTAVCLAALIVLYCVRVAMHPKRSWQAIQRDLPEAAGLSSISIAFTSLIQMAALVFGDSWGTATSALWWVNLGIAIPFSTILPYLFLREQAPGIDNCTPIVLLPMVAATTLAAGGGVLVSNTKASQDSARLIVVLSFLFLGLAMPLALLFDAAYAVRLLDKTPPASDKVAQDMILCGPWAQGSFAMQALGRYLATAAPALPILTGVGLPTQQASFVVGCGSMFLGFVFWGQAVLWWFFAVLSILRSWISHRLKSSSPVSGPQYALSAWSLVFPWVGSPNEPA